MFSKILQKTLFAVACGLMLQPVFRLDNLTAAGKSNSGKGQTEMKLTVACASIPVTRDISSNIKTIQRAIDYAVEHRADILLTPEGSLSGYTPEFDQKEVNKGLEQILKKASDKGLALALGTCFIEPADKKCYNQIRFYDKGGNFLGFHSKTLTCGNWDNPPKGEINDYEVQPLRTYTLDGITIGGLICNDMWGNPECTPMPDTHLSQQLSKMDAKIIFHAVNGGRNGGDWSREVYWPYHETNLRMRAKAGRIWIATADNCHPTNIPCSAPTGVVGPDGNWAVKAPSQGENIVVFTIELD